MLAARPGRKWYHLRFDAYWMVSRSPDRRVTKPPEGIDVQVDRLLLSSGIQIQHLGHQGLLDIPSFDFPGEKGECALHPPGVDVDQPLDWLAGAER